MNNRIVIIGASELQYDLVFKAKQLGYETHVFAWENGAIARNIADYFYPISITEKDIILKYAKNIDPIGICSIASDLANITVNYVGRELGLVVNNDDCILYSTNKYEMRKQFKKNSIPSPEFYIVESANDLKGFVSFPKIVKPIDRSGSRGVTLVHNNDELRCAIKSAKKASFVNQVLIEDFVEGNEYSVEMISKGSVHHFLQITQKITTGAPNFIEKAHISPANISLSLKNEIIKSTKIALDALKIQNGASHSELKIKSDGTFSFIEIGSRMGGDFIGSKMVKLTTGVDFVRKVIDVAVGRKLVVEKLIECAHSIVHYIYTKTDLELFHYIKASYPQILVSFSISDKLSTIINDSSSRNGFFILEIKNELLFKDILLKMNNSLALN